MTQFGPPVLLTDCAAFGRPQALREALVAAGDPRVFLSPDRQHLIVCVTRQRRLLSFPRLPGGPSPPPQAGEYLEQSWPAHAPPVCGLLFLQGPSQTWLLALVWENGRAEVWGPPRGPSGRVWTLLQSVELCGGPRASLVSICADGAEFLWCEKRPPSKSVGAPSPYCVCRRSLRVSGQRVTLGTVRIVLHHSPAYTMASASGIVFMVPKDGRLPLLVYSPADETVAVSTLTTGTVHHKALTETDYKKLTLEYAGYVAHCTLPEIKYSSATDAGRLLLLTTTGQIHLLLRDGAVRHIYDLDASLGSSMLIKMEVFGGTLACTAGSTLYLIDLDTGQLMAKLLLPAEEAFLMKLYETDDVQFLTKAGVYKVSRAFREETSTAESALLEMVYEEACKYYQRRSLSGTRLTVEVLKKEGMFQAPITLSTILNDYRKKGGKTTKYSDLLNNLTNELQSFSSLEHLKSGIVSAADTEVDKYCDELVDHEIGRLLQAELDRDSLVYLNFLFTAFPKSAWMSLRNNFQFQQNGDGKLVVRATADLWKKVLSTLPAASKESAQNGIYPLFEIICQSLCAHKPKWLPGFVQHAQECSGLSWNFTAKENGEGGPLYKRALSILNKRSVDLEVELLMGSGRPQAIIQAIHILIRLQRWPRVMEETLRHAQVHPLIRRDVFTTLLLEFMKHRHLDAYLNELGEICPEDLSATDILGMVLQNMPTTEEEPVPFSREGGATLTVGLIKPLLNKVLQNQLKRDKELSSPSSPPITPQRTNRPHNPPVNGDDQSPTDFYATKPL